MIYIKKLLNKVVWPYDKRDTQRLAHYIDSEDYEVSGTTKEIESALIIDSKFNNFTQINWEPKDNKK